MTRTQTVTAATTDEGELLTAAQAAGILGYSTQHVWRLARAGELPHIRIKGRYRFRRSHLASWLADYEADGDVRAVAR